MGVQSCHQCGATPKEGQHFCRRCGAKLHSDSTPAVDEAIGQGAQGRGRPVVHRGLWFGVIAGMTVGAILLAVAMSLRSGSDDPQADADDPEEAVAGIGRASSDQTLHLEPVASPGEDAFTGSVAATDPGTATTFGDEGRVVWAPEVIDTSQSDAIPVVRGSQPELYGGSGDVAVCDKEALVAFLSDSPDKAAAWAAVLGIESTEIAHYVGGLAPVLLRVDTLVTNHGYSEGTATPRVSVLQAGTAVLVDEQGVPRVRCACGNPLGEGPAELSMAEVRGDGWDGYDERRVARIAGEGEVTTLEVADVDTGTTTVLRFSDRGVVEDNTIPGVTFTPPAIGDWVYETRVSQHDSVSASIEEIPITGFGISLLAGRHLDAEVESRSWAEPVDVDVPGADRAVLIDGGTGEARQMSLIVEFDDVTLIAHGTIYTTTTSAQLYDEFETFIASFAIDRTAFHLGIDLTTEIGRVVEATNVEQFVFGANRGAYKNGLFCLTDDCSYDSGGGIGAMIWPVGGPGDIPMAIGELTYAYRGATPTMRIVDTAVISERPPDTAAAACWDDDDPESNFHFGLVDSTATPGADLYDLPAVIVYEFDEQTLTVKSIDPDSVRCSSAPA